MIKVPIKSLSLHRVTNSIIKRKTVKAKEPIRIRFKKLANGNESIYLDYYKDGKREYEFLKLYIIPEKTASDRTQNEETLRTANAIKAQRVVSLQNSQHGFSSSGVKGRTNFIDYLRHQAEKYDEKGSKAYATSVRNTNRLETSVLRECIEIIALTSFR